MSEPFQLYRLQQTDSALDRVRVRLKEIEEALSDDAAVQKVTKQAEQAKQAYQSAQIALKQAEQDAQAQEEKIDKNQKRTYSGTVTNPKELEDLQLEAAALKRHLATLEDNQLEAMVAFEEVETAHQDADDNLVKVKDQAAQQSQDLHAEQEELLAQVVDLEGERNIHVGNLNNDAIATYNKLRDTRRGVAVALVKDKNCSACGATLTAAQAQAARSPSQITKCDSCRRILYSG